MSNLIPKLFPLNAGLDLSSPKMLAEPGSLIDCLNYELVDFEGYRRIDGYTRYDGNVVLTDLPSNKVLEGNVLTTTGIPPFSLTNTIFQDDNGNDIGFIFSASRIIPGTTVDIRYIMFEGTETLYGNVGSWGFKGSVGNHTEASITQTELITLQSLLRSEVTALPETAVGLHWFRNHLYAVVPQLMIHYQASAVNEVVAYEIGGALATTFSAATAIIRDKIIITEADASTAEEGFFFVEDLGTGDWSALLTDTETLSGDVSVGSGSLYHQPINLVGPTSTACSLWQALRPGYYNVDKTPVTPGWEEQPLGYTATVELTGVLADGLFALRKGNTISQSSYYFDDGVTPVEFILLDYFVVSGDFDTGDAVIKLQFEYPGFDVDTSYTLNNGPGGSTVIANVVARMTLNSLPGFPQLKEDSSRYLFISSNFYASDEQDAAYGVNGASRAFTFGGMTNTVSFIYTQADDALDIPRHIENHAEHLVLGFKVGSVQLSVVGQPTNFLGIEGASEFGVSSRVTGLYALNGTTLAIFCTDRIKSITGTTIENFSLETITPKTGCIEYTLANCGGPVFVDNRGISTLDASDKYGDFVNGRLSTKVFSKLRTKFRKGVVGFSNSSGVACAIPVRDKNQYRLFFNDGQIVTMTLRGDSLSPAFTFQKYYLQQNTISDENSVLVPFAWTSEVDDYGVERMFVSHYNEDSAISTKHVFALDTGDSFDGKYIPHYFTINWYFSDNPQTFSTLHGIRLHGLSRGLAKLKVQAAGAQNDFYFSGASLSTTPTPINLPRTSTGIVADFHETTNRCDIAARGLAIQLKFSGSNTDLSLIEPSHVAQVLITYSTPDGAFDL